MEKKWRTGLCGLLGVVLSLSALSQSASLGVWNYATGYQKGILGTLDDDSGQGTIVTKFWAAGRAAEQNSGSLFTRNQVMPYGDGQYFVWSDWGNGGTVGSLLRDTDRTVFLYSIANGGRGQYLLLSVAMDATFGFNFDDVVNGACAEGQNVTSPTSISKPVVRGWAEDAEGVQVDLAWDPIQDLKGYYDREPVDNLVTGLAIRYAFSSSPPTSTRTSDWALAEGGYAPFGTVGGDPGAASVRVPRAPEGLATYFALSVLFDGALPGSGSCSLTESVFVGEPTAVASPVPDPAFGSVAAARRGRDRVRVTWSMVEEGGCLYYQVMGSAQPEGPWLQYGDLVPVDSLAGGSYTVQLRGRGMAFVKVMACTDAFCFPSHPVAVR